MLSNPLLCVLCLASPVAAQMLGPQPYLSSSDSPFDAGELAWYYNETFEDHALTVPGVTPDHGGVTSVLFGPDSGIDSVDADDGVIDGSGLGGDSWFYGVGTLGVTWTFDASVLGQLPTHAGIVWTDGERLHPVLFEAWDAEGQLIGSATGIHGDLDGLGGTAEDRFYGVIHMGGISRIRLSHPDLYIEMDHLQFGYIPAPGTLWCVMAVAGVVRRRRRVA